MIKIIAKKPLTLISILVDELTRLDAEKLYDVEIKEHKEKRSLDANAYFHILVSKLSDNMHIGAEDIKFRMVTDYTEGTYVRLPHNASPLQFGIKYYKVIGEAMGTKQPCTDYLVYKPTHEMNSKEMYNLIQGTREECIAIGIPESDLLTPSEIANIRGIKDGIY